MNLAAALDLATARLAAAGVEPARREARILLAAALRTDAAGLLSVTEVDPTVFAPFLARRAAREPVAYILRRREFWGLALETSPATLIPRPESETLIEAACAIWPDRDAKLRILDLGTGTGCLLLAALAEYPAACGVGVDISAAAAALARRNAAALGCGRRASFLAGDWAAALACRFDLIFSNPPYIPSRDISGLMPEVAVYEPALALDGGADGLQAYRRIIVALGPLLAPGGTAILELGQGQMEDVLALGVSAGFSGSVRADLAGCPRALMLRK